MKRFDRQSLLYLISITSFLGTIFLFLVKIYKSGSANSIPNQSDANTSEADTNESESIISYESAIENSFLVQIENNEDRVCDQELVSLEELPSYDEAIDRNGRNCILTL